MPKMRFTDAGLRSLPIPEKGQVDYWDQSLAGFGIRLSQGGARTFILNIDNARRTIGRFGDLTLSQARAEVHRVRAERTLGRDRPQYRTFRQARDEFLEEKRLTRRPRTYRDLKRFLTLYTPFKGALTEATHGELSRRITRIKAPAERRHAILAIKCFFTWCVRKRYLMDNPATGFTAHVGPPRERVLTDDELKAVWIAAGECGQFGVIVRLLILTGQRRGEIAALCDTCCQLDGNQYTITLPSSLTKNKREHSFPIGPLAARTLRTVIGPRAAGEIGHIFPARGATNKPINGWSKSKAALDEISGVTDWTLHDLRRTFATGLAKLGAPIHVVEKLLNHVSGTTGGLVAVYQKHQYWDEQIKAVNAWNDHIERLVNS